MARKREMRVKYKKAFNKLMKKFNKNIENNKLFKGRFVVHQMYSDFDRFDDNSGGVLYTVIRFIDKKTGYYKDYGLCYAPYLNNYKFWELGNIFITEEAKVWEYSNPYKDNTDYRKIKVEDIWRKPYNFYNMFYLMGRYYND